MGLFKILEAICLLGLGEEKRTTVRFHTIKKQPLLITSGEAWIKEQQSNF